MTPQTLRNYSTVIVDQPSTSSEMSARMNPSEIFEKIVYKLKQGGHVVVIPTNQRQGSDLEKAIRILQDFGLDDQKIVDIFTGKPELFKISADKWREKLRIFQETGFTMYQTILCLSRNPSIFKISQQDLLYKLETVRQIGVKGDKLPTMVYKSPEILTNATNEQIRVSANNLKSFFTTEQVIELLTYHPEVIFQNFDEMEEKYEYIYFNMGLESDKFRKSVRWVATPIEYIEMRHEILARTGAYIRPNPKKPMLSKDNPNLSDIFDTNEYTFATKVAGISVEEYQVFREMFNRQLEMESREEDYDEDIVDAGGFEPSSRTDDKEWAKLGSAQKDDEEDFGGWKKYRKHYQMEKKKKPAMRKRKGRY